MSDGEVFDDIGSLPNVDLREFDGADAIRVARSKIRYLAAFYPDANIRQLAENIHALLGYPKLPLSDLRIILEGRSLADASKLTGEVPVEGIQRIGRVLAAGGSYLEAARQSGLSVDTVERVDRFCGIGQEYEDKLSDLAVTSIREGWTVRKFAQLSGMSRSRAHRYQRRARQVLVELGELV